MENEIVSLQEAKERGLRWYFTGQPCPHGHTGKRNVSNRECRPCVDAKRARRRIEDPVRMRAKDRAKYHQNVERERALQRANRAKHVEKRRAYDRRRYLDPERRAAQLRHANVWWKKNAINRGKVNYQTQLRRAQIRRASPPWLTHEHKREMRKIYIRASILGPDYEVDHIYPLRGKTSCGLHVPWNLQILPKVENRRKRNLLPSEEAA